MVIADLIAGTAGEPLSVCALVGERAVDPGDVLALAERHGARMVDLKFTDLPGPGIASAATRQRPQFEGGAGPDLGRRPACERGRARPAPARIAALFRSCSRPGTRHATLASTSSSSSNCASSATATVGDIVEQRALDAQAQFAPAGHHRPSARRSPHRRAPIATTSRRCTATTSTP